MLYTLTAVAKPKLALKALDGFRERVAGKIYIIISIGRRRTHTAHKRTPATIRVHTDNGQDRLQENWIFSI